MANSNTWKETRPNFKKPLPVCPSNAEPILKYKRLTNNAYPPAKFYQKAAGYDLRSAYHYCVPQRGKAIINTDLQICVPPGCYGRIAGRSGLAAIHHISVEGGVIDPDFSAAIRIIMFNHAERPFQVEKGMRIAQLICEKIEFPNLIEIWNTDEHHFRPGERGPQGFGSTDQLEKMFGK